ncbi:MAG: hypothetical protein KAQ68_11480 [Clostridiales bacterium]|nr:hypothetical protein [Clostridiales bacterium]
MLKSINHTIIISSDSILKIPASIGLILLGFQMVCLLVFALEKHNIKDRQTKQYKFGFLLYMIPSIIIFVFLFLVYFPGQVSADTVYVWTKVGINEFDDFHPLLYTFLFKGLRLIWDNIAVIGLFQIILCAFTYGFIANELDKLDFPKWLCWGIAILLPILPINALYSITLWKDVPYTMGLLILSMLLFKSISTDYYQGKKSFIAIMFVAYFTLNMRHNALLSVFIPLFLFGIYWIIKKDKKLIVKTLILGISLLVLFFGVKSVTSQLLGDDLKEGTLLSTRFPVTIQTQQIIYTQHVHAEDFTSAETEMFNNIFNIDQLNEHKDSASDNIWMYYHKPYLTVNKKFLSNNTKAFRKYYFQLFKKYPSDMIKGYEKLTAIMWASTDLGPTAYRGKSEVIIEGYEPVIPQPILPGLSEKLDSTIFYHRYSNMISDIIWRPAFAFYLMLIFMYVAYKKHGVAVVYLALPAIINQLSYFIVIAAQDVRYSYINITICIIMFILSITPKKSSTISKNITQTEGKL